MTKPTVFVGHAAVDSEIATAFKEDAEASFLGLCPAFKPALKRTRNGGPGLRVLSPPSARLRPT